MNSKLTNLLDNLQFGELNSFKNLQIIPFYYKNGNSLEYISLEKALEKNFITIKEVSEGGSVPELRIVNESDEKVLLLEGEEIVGAKQNRVLNASILLDGKTSTTIPVSCVEAGRWEYRERHFRSSKSSMPPSLKYSMNLSVSEELKRSQGKSFRSDQSEVWNSIDRLSMESNVRSRTRAMSDVYDNMKENIDEYLMQFKVADNQNGMIIFIDNCLAGVEYVSYAKCFADVYHILLKGYSMDALISRRQSTSTDYDSMVSVFLDRVKNGEINTFKSIGIGDDNRIESNSFVASFLYAESEIVRLNALQKVENKNKRFNKMNYE